MLQFAEEATDRAQRDHDGFRADHALDAFRTFDVIYE
jgi:hypothetical protein